MAGKRLATGESSKSGLYAIVDNRKDIVLRISMSREIAEMLTDTSRYVAECWIVPD